MTSELDVLEETLTKVFAASKSEGDNDDANRRTFELLWSALEESGFTLMSVPEAVGGSGGGIKEAALLARVAGRSRSPFSLSDSGLLGGWLLSRAALVITAEPFVAACVSDEEVSCEKVGDGWRLRGTVRGVPYARWSQKLVCLLDGHDGPRVVTTDLRKSLIEAHSNLAGEPRDDVHLDLMVDADAVGIPDRAVTPDAFQMRGAISRTAAMRGAMEAILEMSIAHANDREQFGRPIGKFQAIQQHLAALAGEVACASAGADVAIQSVGDDLDGSLVATAKVQAGLSAAIVTRLAHQIHGAIGITHEHNLHRFTRRLWAWRDEFGSEVEWGSKLGRTIMDAGSLKTWSMVTASSGERLVSRHPTQ